MACRRKFYTESFADVYLKTRIKDAVYLGTPVMKNYSEGESVGYFHIRTWLERRPRFPNAKIFTFTTYDLKIYKLYINFTSAHNENFNMIENIENLDIIVEKRLLNLYAAA